MRSHRSAARPGEAARFEQPKILVKDTTKDFACTYEEGTYYAKDVLIVIPKVGVTPYDLKALAGIINSKALGFFYRTTFKTLHVQNGELASLPLPLLDFQRNLDKVAHERLVSLVAQMLEAEDKKRGLRPMPTAPTSVTVSTHSIRGLTNWSISSTSLKRTM
jgi:TaqI-like C-terminal specificity domain